MKPSDALAQYTGFSLSFQLRRRKCGWKPQVPKQLSARHKSTTWLIAEFVFSVHERLLRNGTKWYGSACQGSRAETVRELHIDSEVSQQS